MLVKIMEIKVLVKLLLVVEGCCKSHDWGKFVQRLKGAFTSFEVLSPYPINVHWMPVNLAASIVRMPMEGRNHPM